MPRALTTNLTTALTAPVAHPFFLFEATFDTTTIDLWSGIGNLSWGGKTWLGNGWFSGFDKIQETNDIKSVGVNVELLGVPSTLVSLVLSATRKNATGSLYLGCFDDSGAIIADPFMFFQGRLDIPSIVDSETTSTITLSYESSLARLQTARKLLFTDASQRSLFPNDSGFIYVESLQNWKDYWGKKSS